MPTQVVSVANTPHVFEASGPAKNINFSSSYVSYTVQGSVPQGGGISNFDNPVAGNLFYDGHSDTGEVTGTPTPINVTLDNTGISVGGPYTLSLFYSGIGGPPPLGVDYEGTFSVAPYLILSTPTLTCGQTGIVLSWITNVPTDTVFIVKRNGAFVASVSTSPYTATTAIGVTDTYTVEALPSTHVSNAVVVSPFACPPSIPCDWVPVPGPTCSPWTPVPPK